jgi:NADH dehydrogenase
MGRHVARLIRAELAGRAAPAPFRYRHAGSLATIGRRAAVADLGPIRLTGGSAWILWATAHVWFLIGWRHRLIVALNWLWNYVTFERGARLITGASSEAMGAPGDPGASSSSSGRRHDEARREAVGAA